MSRRKSDGGWPGERKADVPSLAEAWRAQLFRGLRALELDDHEAAARHFEAALRIERRPEACYALARERIRSGRADEAAELLREAWADGSGLPVAAATLARILGIEEGSLEEAHALLESAVARFPEEPNLLVVRGELYLEADDPAAARTCFESALARGADRDAAEAGLARVLNAEGVQLGEAGDHDRALFAFRRAAALDPSWSGPHVNAAVVFASMGRPSRALESYDAALRVEPRNAAAHANLGHLRRELGDTAAARAAFERALELDPDHSSARGALADLYGSAGEFDRAIRLFEETLAREPGDARTWVNLGMAHGFAGHDAEAERCLRHALELDPSDGTACCQLATALGRQGRYAEAAELTRRAYQLDPEKARAWFEDAPARR